MIDFTDATVLAALMQIAEESGVELDLEYMNYNDGEMNEADAQLLYSLLEGEE